MLQCRVFHFQKGALLLAFVAGSSAILFPGGGGGGGCGGDTSCFPTLPRLQCQRSCFSFPTLALPPPPNICGKRKKRAVNGDEKCTDPELRKLILAAVRNDLNESRSNIVAALKEKHGEDTEYSVSCVKGEVVFQSSADEFCLDGTSQTTCLVAL